MALVSIVFSFRNEEEVLPLLIRSVETVLERQPENYELIFVDDASTDRSVEVIAETARARRADSRGRIRLVRLSRRFGVEECFLAGLEQAAGDAVILMYTDMQDPPEVIGEMLARWREGAEIVHAVRRRRLGEARVKLIAAHIAYRLVSKLADISIPVDSGEFKLMSRRVTQHLLALRETDPYLRGLIPWIGFKQSTVTYDMQPRAAGRSKVALLGGKAWTVFLSGMTSFSILPIYVTLLTGLVGSVISVILLIAFSVAALSGWISTAPVWVAFALVLWATLLCAIGWAGIYVSRIYKDVRGRPRYIVDHIDDFTDRAGATDETSGSRSS